MQGLENKPNQKCSQLSVLNCYCVFTIVPNPFVVLSHLIFPVALSDDGYLLVLSVVSIYS